MMQQYESAKQACGDALLLFRMGDFYELFHDDAKTAARVLGLTLTSRDKTDNPIPMAGFPHHQLDSYLGKLIRAGYRAAICEQVEDPKLAKGLVRREVTRIVTPGTVTDEGLLDPCTSNFLCAICPGSQRDDDQVGVAWIDLSTGRFQAMVCAARDLPDELGRLQPAECLTPEACTLLPDYWQRETIITKRAPHCFRFEGARERLCRHFDVATLEGFGFAFGEVDQPAISAAGAVLDYLFETQKTSLDHIESLLRYRKGSRLEIDESTRRSLEISRTLRDGRRDGSLLAVIDRCVTPMGSRLLADWVASPLTERDAIERRLDAVDELVQQPASARLIRDELKDVYDLERLLGRVATGRCGPRDLRFIGLTLSKLPVLKEHLQASNCDKLRQLEMELHLFPELCAHIDRALVEDCPLLPRDGGFIRSGYQSDLDELRELAAGGKRWIAEYQADQVANSGIPSLKVGFNKVFGYYIEITNAHSDKIPAHFIRKQTLKNAERYVTAELKEYEEKVLSADERSKVLEYELFVALRDEVQAAARRLQGVAAVLAELDVLAGLSELARQQGYVRPTIDERPILQIVDGRHPVLDRLQPQGAFVPNDTICDADSRILLITGPNMAGKSTYIRQVALITLMAQLGSFVPATRATIGIADRIFARVGASDELSRGQSTFMVEMTETARILHHATPRSLVILDEIGRGTSTYDGLSIAWAIVEHLHDQSQCRTLFATHYHELTQLAQQLSSVANWNVAVKEWDGKIIFLHKIVPGAADRSYGIHVAQLAGVPREVNHRAEEILAELESRRDPSHSAPPAPRARRSGQYQLTLFEMAEHPLVEELRQLDLHALTPIDALLKLQRWQADLLRDQPAQGRARVT